MGEPRRYRLDANVRRHGDVVVGGSPLILFTLTGAGSAIVDRIADGDEVPDSKLVTSLLDAGAIHPLHDGRRPALGPDDVTVVTPTYGPPAHVVPGAIVVDDGSDAPVAGASVRLTDNRGPAAARNRGLALVETPLVAFVDADVEIEPGWLDPLLPHFDDERVALVAPRARSRPGPSVLATYDAAQSPLDLGSDPANVRPGSRVSYVPAAALVCRADALRQVGGFDDELRFGEDVDLVWRLAAAGWRCRYEPASSVLHSPRPDWTAWLRQRIGYGASAAPLAKRHPGALAPVRMNGWSLTSWLLTVSGRPLVGAALGTGSAAALTRLLPGIPARAAFRIGAEGNLRAGDQLASAVRRAWWPMLLIASVRSTTARRVLGASALAVRHPLRVVDDVAYSLGVWKGMIRERTAAPLVPQISAWPPRSRTGRRRRSASPTNYRRTT